MEEKKTIYMLNSRKEKKKLYAPTSKHAHMFNKFYRDLSIITAFHFDTLTKFKFKLAFFIGFYHVKFQIYNKVIF